MRALVAILILLHAPLAAAHAQHGQEPLEATSGDLTVRVTPRSPLIKALREVAFVGEGSFGGRPLVNASWTFEAEGPSDARVVHEPAGRGFSARATFFAPGNWTLRVGADGRVVELPLRVYAATNLHADSDTLRYGGFSGSETVANLSLYDDFSGALVAKEARVQARIERWEGAEKRGEDVVETQEGDAPGRFVVRYAFPREGAYLIRVASAELGVGFEDVPPIPVRVFAGRESPAAGGAILALALVAGALVARRR